MLEAVVLIGQALKLFVMVWAGATGAVVLIATLFLFDQRLLNVVNRCRHYYYREWRLTTP